MCICLPLPSNYMLATGWVWVDHEGRLVARAGRRQMKSNKLLLALNWGTFDATYLTLHFRSIVYVCDAMLSFSCPLRN